MTVDRQQAARYQINSADVQDAIQTAVGGNALTQVLQGEEIREAIEGTSVQRVEIAGSLSGVDVIVKHVKPDSSDKA